MQLWRISDHVDLGGWGGRKFSSRWASLGRRIVYLAESPAGALLEVLVHLEFDEGELPDKYQLIEVSIPEGISIRGIEPPSRIDWKEKTRITQRIGDTWLASRETPLAHVPSAIVPRTRNYLLNPEHPDAKQVQVAEVIKERFDNRLFRFGVR
ncbi:MAG: RES family NAD+ phosphorylase [Terracidiphilus sp.]